MNLVKFVEELSAQGIELWVGDERLRYRFSRNALTQTLLSKIKQRKTEILQLLRDPTVVTKTYPLSHGQQALWFLQQSALENVAYNTASGIRILSPVDASVLRRTLQTLTNRHPSLRTTFTMEEGRPVQAIHGYREVDFQETDASKWSTDELRERVIKAYRQPFDLQQGPLLRASLFTRSREEHVFFVTIHHIVFDAWSTWIFWDEFAQLLSAEKSGDVLFLPPIDRQYSDYVRWQEDVLENEEGKQLGTYWQKQLAGELPTLDLPTDRPRPPVQTYNGASRVFTLTDELSERLRGLARAEGATPFMVFLAAFQVLLHRYTGQEDILVGSPTAGRGRTEFSGIVGYFVNMMVLIADLSGNPTFRAFLRQVRQTVWDALEHQDYPFPLLVERLQPKRDPSRSLIFQASFALQKPQKHGWVDQWASGDEGIRIQLEGLEVEPFDMPQQEGQFDLDLELSDREKNFAGVFKYNTDLFDEATIARMTEHFRVLLEGMLDNPEQPLSRLPLLTEAERQQLLAWNRTETAYPQDKTIVDLFQEQVEKTPENIAVVFEDRQLSYRELNTRANRLAHYLMALGVGAEILVGICVERSPEIVVGLLGILKAGGAYVPLDPEYPLERLQFMLEDSGVKVLLSQSSLLEELPESDAKVVCLDSEWAEIAGYSEDNPVRQSGPENLAYVIYTSGSTGRPKGVEILHCNVFHSYWAWNADYQLSHLRSHLQMANFSFDVFTGDWIRALGSGAKLILCPYDTLLAPEDLYQLLCMEKVDCAEFVPSVIRELIHYLKKEGKRIDYIKLLIVGSDIWTFKEYKNIKEICHSSVRIINSYGVSEATIDSTYFEQTQAVIMDEELPVPIGKPFIGTQIYILDIHHSLTPLDIPGELCIAGAGLARGYLNRPELTAEKFIEVEVFGKKERLYKTGDLARWLPDGNIEFLGRIDHQVKLRGFRIELGEVEATLSRHKAVREAVVVLYRGDDNPRLVAYVTLAMAVDEPSSVLHPWLKARLPEYMVPASFTVLDVLPLTSNGKIDRRALSRLSLDDRQLSGRGFIASRSPTELQLTGIWEELLNVHPIGVHDNFFEIGGHSLLAIRLLARIEQAFGKKLPLATLFQEATIEALAIRIRQQVDLPWSPMVPIQPKGSKPPLFVAPPGGGHAMAYMELARYLGANQPFYGLQALGLEAGQKPHTTVEDVAAFFLEALQTIEPQGPYYLAGWSFGGLVAFEMAQQLQAQGQQVSFLALLDTWLPSRSPKEDHKQDEIDVLMTMFANDISLSREEIRQIESDKQLTYLIGHCQQLGLLPLGFGPEDARRILQVSDTYGQAMQRYQPRLYRGKIIFFQAGEKLAEADGEPSSGWDGFTTEGVEIHQVSGNHRNMVYAPHAQVLAEKLKMCLEQA